jgi:hypothetical protein
MADKFFPFSELPIRKLVELLPKIFQIEVGDKLPRGSAAQLNLQNLAVNTLIN